MKEISGDVAFANHVDSPDFYGEGAAGYRLSLVTNRSDFLDLFENARHVDAITYAETPKLMVDMLTEYGVDSLDVLIGNADNYKENKVENESTAKSLVDLRQEDRLTIRLKNQKTVHSKIYRVVMSDDEVRLVHGSANLSENSWNNHTNQISVFTTTVGSELDDEFCKFIDEYRNRYSDQTLLDGLVEAVEQAEDEDERDERIKYWVGGGDLDGSDTASVATDAAEDIKDVAEDIVAVVDDPEDADDTVAFVDEPENVDESVVTQSTSSESAKSDGGVETENPDVSLSEADQETDISENLDRPRAKAADEKIRIGTTRIDSDVADEFGKSLANKGGTVEDNSILAPVGAYTEEIEERTSIPLMSVLPEQDQVIIGEDDEIVFVATENASDELLDHCLKTIEDYVETVDKHGHTKSPDAVKAQMYEAFLYGFWSPFANQYAEHMNSPSRTLTNILQHLYIVGKSDAGKDKLVEYILRLISDNTVTSGVDADEVGVREVRGIREYDTAFPYAMIDAEKNKIQDWSPIRNYWEDYTPSSPDRPCMIFTTNDRLPKSEFQNRMKLLTMDVEFPSSPEDRGYREADDELSEIIERQNPIFSYVAREMLKRKPWKEGHGTGGTVSDVREIMNDLYERAGREKPDYYPAEEPAEKTFSTGRIEWLRDIRAGRVTFEVDPEGIAANFGRNKYDVQDLEKRLPKRMQSDQSHTTVTIGGPEEFAEWVGFSVEELLNGDADQSENMEYARSNDAEDESDDSGFFSRFF